jgi:hypothetical protein
MVYNSLIFMNKKKGENQNICNKMNSISIMLIKIMFKVMIATVYIHNKFSNVIKIVQIIIAFNKKKNFKELLFTKFLIQNKKK